MDGPGKASVTSWGPERRVVEVSGVSDNSALAITMPPYRKWYARQEGIFPARLLAGTRSVSISSPVHDQFGFLTYGSRQ